MKKSILVLFTMMLTIFSYAQSNGTFPTQGTPLLGTNFKAGALFDSIVRLPVRGHSVLYPNIPKKGSIQYNSTTDKIEFYNTSTWQYLATEELVNTKVSQDNNPIKGVASGTNTYTVTLNPAPVSYLDGAKFFVKFTSANTGASTLNINGLGAKNITVGGQSLTGGIIDSNVWYMLIYNLSTDSFRLTTSNKVNTQALGDISLNIANMQALSNAIGALNLNILYTKTDAVPSLPVNNTTTNTIVKSYAIPAGTIQTGVVNVKAQFERTAVGGALNWRVYINTSNTLTGATLFSTTSLATNSTTKVTNYERNAYVNMSSPTAATLTLFSTTQSGGVLNTTALDPEVLNINPSVILYIIFAIELNNSITENARVAATDISIKKSN